MCRYFLPMKFFPVDCKIIIDPLGCTCFALYALFFLTYKFLKV